MLALLFAGRCQGGFKVGCAHCEIGHCKIANKKRGQVHIWDPCSKPSGLTYPEILIFFVSWKALEVSVPDSAYQSSEYFLS